MIIFIQVITIKTITLTIIITRVVAIYNIIIIVITITITIILFSIEVFLIAIKYQMLFNVVNFNTIRNGIAQFNCIKSGTTDQLVGW